MTIFNIFRDRFVPLARGSALVFAIAGLLCACGPKAAFGQERPLSQYVHDRWDAHNGFSFGEIFAISQSNDGYLWIGTAQGLVRFDGTRFVLVDRPIPGLPPWGPVRGLVADKQGNLWIRGDGRRLLRYRNGKFSDAFASAHHSPFTVTGMFPAPGVGVYLWATGRWGYNMFTNGIKAISDPNLSPWIVLSLATSSDGKVWLGTSGNGLFQMESGNRYRKAAVLGETKIDSLAAASDGALWIGTDHGLLRLDGNRVTSSEFPQSLQHAQILSLVVDRFGNLWAGTNRGLLRVSSTPNLSAEPVDPARPGEVNAVFIDREGELWYGGADGLERLRAGVFRTWSAAQGLPAEINGPIYAARDGRIWFAPRRGGLYWLRNGHLGRVAVAGLDHDIVYSISGGGGQVWVGRQRGGLTCLTETGTGFAARTYTVHDGLAENTVYSVMRARDGTIWAGTVSAGISRLKDGVFTNYSIAQGLPSNAVNAIAEQADGTIWAATPDGPAFFAHGAWKPFPDTDQLPSTDVLSLFEDSGKVLWMSTSSGLAFLNSGRLEVPQNIPGALRNQILGIAEDGSGHMWIVTPGQVLRVSRSILLSGQVPGYDLRSYGIEDGLTQLGGVNRDRSLVAGPKGRIWISLVRGVAMADPQAVTGGSDSIHVRIDSVTVGNASLFPGRGKYRVPPNTNNIGFVFSAATFEDPQGVRFRYRLDGSDQDWSSAAETRQVTYRNLDPGSYRFQVEASRNGDFWNNSAASVSFEIERAYWQTWWFTTLCVVVGLLLIALIYRLRTWQLAGQLNARFQERLAERNRIAQDLHDTLLQGFISASMQVDIAEDCIPDDSPAKPLLQRALQLMKDVTEEGRNSLRGLRPSEQDRHSLEVAFSRIGEELAQGRATEYRVRTESAIRALRPSIRDEVYRIGREAIVNSFKHAKAGSVEVEVEYAGSRFRVLVRDDGVGIDPAIMTNGKDGHWGLTGMRERADSIGATLKLRSRLGAGTEVELTVPGSIAFVHAGNGIWRTLRGRSHAQQASEAHVRKTPETKNGEQDERHKQDANPQRR